MKYDVENAR